MKAFIRFALASVFGTYLVIFIGGLVRVSGAGLGCPDWPSCFGRWFPPTSVDQLPAYIDPSRFNVVLAWIEYINRLCGALLGIVIVITAVFAIIHCRHNFKVMIGAISSAVLVALIGAQGAFVIYSELEPIVVSVHMLLAMLLACSTIYTAQHAYYEKNKSAEQHTIYPLRTQRFMLFLWCLAGLQVVLGTQMRSKLEKLAEQFPLMSDIEWLSGVGGLNHVHMTLGIVLLLISIIAGRRIINGTKELPTLARSATLMMLVLISLQVVLGFVFMLVGIPELARVFHLWVASLYLGSVFVIYSSARRARSRS